MAHTYLHSHIVVAIELKKKKKNFKKKGKEID